MSGIVPVLLASVPAQDYRLAMFHQAARSKAVAVFIAFARYAGYGLSDRLLRHRVSVISGDPRLIRVGGSSAAAFGTVGLPVVTLKPVCELLPEPAPPAGSARWSGIVVPGAAEAVGLGLLQQVCAVHVHRHR